MSGEEPPLWPAAVAVASDVEDGMVVGLGTGRAAAMFVRALARRVASGLEIRGVPTSIATERLAAELALPLAGLDEVDSIDVDVDGADEVDPDLNLIKGHGGALVRERVVASISKRFVVLVGEDKLVPRLGSRMSVPVEVVPFASPVTARKLRELGCEVGLRMRDGKPFASDNGNHILDARFDEISDPAELELRIDRLAGVVDSGLFVAMAESVLVQSESGFRRLQRRGSKGGRS